MHVDQDVSAPCLTYDEVPGNAADASAKRDLSDELTVFVLTVGRADSLGDCYASLSRQTVTFRIRLIEKVAPLSSALQQMIDRCETRYFAEVDEDMILFPNAIETLFDKLAGSSGAALVCGGLIDCYMASPIQGIKLYRHDIAKVFPFENRSGADFIQFEAMKAAGYEMILLPLEGSQCVGEHDRNFTPESLFCRWQKWMLKHRRHNNMPWLLCWPHTIWERFLKTKNQCDLYAFLGISTGLVMAIPVDGEADFRNIPCDLAALNSVIGRPSSEPVGFSNPSPLSSEQAVCAASPPCTIGIRGDVNALTDGAQRPACRSKE